MQIIVKLHLQKDRLSDSHVLFWVYRNPEFNGRLTERLYLDNDGSLFLNKTLLKSENDVEGTYTCLARNVVGNDSIDYSLYE